MKKQDKNIKNDSSAAENKQTTIPEDSEPDPKWVTQVDTFVKVDEGDVLLNLVVKVQVLSENYETLRTALTLVFPRLAGKVKVLSENYLILSKAYEELRANLLGHTHDASGKVILHPEAIL